MVTYPPFLHDIGMYLKIGAAWLAVMATFLSTRLIKEAVYLFFFVFFLLKLLFGNVFFWCLQGIFMPPLPVDMMVNSNVSLGASSFLKNLMSTKWDSTLVNGLTLPFISFSPPRYYLRHWCKVEATIPCLWSHGFPSNMGGLALITWRMEDVDKSSIVNSTQIMPITC